MYDKSQIRAVTAREPKQEEYYEQNGKHGVEDHRRQPGIRSGYLPADRRLHDLSVGYSGMKKRLARKFGSEYDDYADEELYE